MWSDGVVDVLPVFKIFVMVGKILGGVCKLIILFPVCSVSSFDTAVEFWASGWKDKKFDTTFFVSLLKE